MFNSVSRQHGEVWASQFPFLHSLKEVIASSEACLYGHINWSLAQAHSVGLSQSFPPKRGGKARPWTGFQFTVQKRPMSGSVLGTSGASLPKWPHLESGNEACPHGKKFPPVLLSQEGKVGVGVGTPGVPQPSTSSCSSSSTSAMFQVGMLFKFFDQWRSITSNRFVLNMVRGHHLQLRTCPPLFCDFLHFNVKATAAHHPVIQKEVDELLAKGAIEPSFVGAGFYSSMFVVPKHTGGLCPILNLKCFNHYMHIPSFKMPSLKNIWQLIWQDDFAFSIDLQDAYLHVPIVKHHHHFLCFVWHNVSYQWKVLPFGLATAPRVFTSLTKCILFLCHWKGLHIVIYLDDILVLVCSKWAGKRVCLFLCSLLVCLGVHINFPKSDLCLSQSFTFLGLCWDTVCMLVSLPPDKLADIQQLALSLLCTPHVTVCKVMSFLVRANFCTNGHSQLWHLCRVIQSDMLSVYHSPTQLFSHVHFSLSSLHQLEWLATLQQSSVSLQFPLPDVVIATEATPTH